MSREKTSAWVRLTTTGAGRVALVASEAGLVLSTLPGRAEVTNAAKGDDVTGRNGRSGADFGCAAVVVAQSAGSPRRRAPARRVRVVDPPAAAAGILDRAEKALIAYYAAWPQYPGARILSLWNGLLQLPVDLDGLPFFTRTVLELLRQVPPGQVLTYGELAARAGSPRAARAVGSVMAHNPLPIILPCHRVVASDGTLGGFAGETKEEALAFKALLLRYEGWAASS